MTILSAKGLTKSFRGIHAVCDVSIDVGHGVTGLIGPNGAGKTTLFSLFSGYLQPDAGTTQLEGRNLTSLPAHKVAAAGVVRTFQVPRPFRKLSVRDNVATASLLKAKTRSKALSAADEMLERVDLHERADRDAGELGIADLKRIELARAIALEPKVLLLDEVFSGLNPTEMDELIPVVRTVQETGIAVILVEHVLEVVMRLSSHVIVLDRGAVIASDGPEAIMKDPAVIQAYLGTGGTDEMEEPA